MLSENGVGIWLDKHKALILKIDGTALEKVELESDLERQHRSTGGVRSAWHFWHRSTFSSRRMQERRLNALKGFFKLIDELLRIDDIVFILGPGEAKHSLKQYLLEHGHKSENIHPLGVTTSRVRQAEIIARIKQHFHVQDRFEGKGAS